jgi:hypothetical protein
MLKVPTRMPVLRSEELRLARFADLRTENLRREKYEKLRYIKSAFLTHKLLGKNGICADIEDWDCCGRL